MTTLSIFILFEIWKNIGREFTRREFTVGNFPSTFNYKQGSRFYLVIIKNKLSALVSIYAI